MNHKRIGDAGGTSKISASSIIVEAPPASQGELCTKAQSPSSVEFIHQARGPRRTSPSSRVRSIGEEMNAVPSICLCKSGPGQ